MRTTAMPKLQVEIPEKLKKDLRIYTYEQGLTLSEAATEALEEWLGRQGCNGYAPTPTSTPTTPGGRKK